MLLSITDFATGLVGNSGYVVFVIQILKEELTCLTFVICDLLVFCVAGMSLATSFLLNAERYLSIVHPFLHRCKVTKYKLLLAVAFLWSIAISVILSPILFGSNSRVGSSATLTLVIIACIYFYAAIYFAKQRARKKFRSEERTSRTETVAQIQEMKLAKSCSIVIACTVVCFVPFAVTYPLVPENLVIYSLKDWACVLSLSASFFNSLVFFWNNPVLKNEAKKVLLTLFAL